MRFSAALLLAGLSASTGAQAVEVYGIVDMSLGYAKGSNSVTRLDDGRLSASRVGFRGTEEIAPNLKAKFVLESGFSADTGAEFFGNNSLFGRQAYVGLFGNWGELRLGRQFTPAFYSLEKIDAFRFNSFASPILLISKTSSQGTGYVPYGSRFNNAVGYLSPNFNGVVVRAALAAGETAGSTRSGSGASASIDYDKGPLYAFYAVQRSYTAVTAAAPEAYASTHQYAGAAYWFDSVRLGGFVGTSKSEAPATRSARYAGLNLIWKATSQNTLLAEAVRRDVRGTDNQLTSFGFGVDHLLSKRTTLYARMMTIDNPPGGGDNINAMPIAAGSGDSGKSINVGVRHTF
ncbi:porin [Noviherbaspirillum malthae]|uniref:porin n=1 Tax=Noviherbaspirillum malthae TaxID=1260987 RepID=UPI00188EE11F|nr:porin [Noviherbaspirillum malthae]